MIRKLLSTAISVIFVLWLVGWFLAVGPHGAWFDVSHLATHVYSWVHANMSSAKGQATSAPSAS